MAQLIPILSVLVIILLSMIVTRVATIALTLTGMSRQAARFQARSALTGAGFTTSESESIVNHPVRRRIVMTLMLIGSAGIVSVLAGVMLSFTLTTTAGQASLTLVVLLGGVGGIFALMNVRPVDRALSRLIRRTLRRYTDLDVRDYAAILEIHGGYAVSELRVEPGDWLANQTLAELGLTHEGVLVLGVQRPDGNYVGAPTGATRIQPGDVLVLYGHNALIADLDKRPYGPDGQRRHDAAATEWPLTDDLAVDQDDPSR